MDLVLSGLSYEICLVYLDDIILFSSTFEEHLYRLELVFERLRNAKLKLKPSKCSFMQRQVPFLGHIVSEHGVEVQPEKTETVVKWPTPRSIHDVRSFVSLCGYYRRFVAGFANVATPLYALTKKEPIFSGRNNVKLHSRHSNEV
jgi:Reverse transcriptase (RNA-dependent DNA polymerase)